METRRRLWVLAVVLGVGGCAGEDATAPPAAAPVSKAPASPGAGRVETTRGGGMPAEAGPGKNALTPKAPAATGGEAKQDEAPPLEPPKTGAANKVSLTEAQIAKIKTLPSAEQDAALKQAVCPVSGEHLGSMGTPFKITAEGRTFYLCCDGCEDKVKEDPRGVLAKLEKK
jgi:YHS domain-containing protein